MTMFVTAKTSFGRRDLPKVALNPVDVIAGATTDWAADNVPLGAVTSWAPGVGTATFTSPTDAAAPTAVVYNGQRVIRTNGTSQRLGVSISLTQPTTVVLVARHVSLPAGSQYLISRGTGVGFNIGSSGNNALWQMIAGATLNAPSMSVPDTKPHVFIASLNGASSAFNIDGAEVTGNAGTVNETTMWLGGSQTAWFNTDYYRLAVIPGTMTAPQREAIRAQMAARYGI